MSTHLKKRQGRGVGGQIGCQGKLQQKHAEHRPEDHLPNEFVFRHETARLALYNL